MDPKRVIVLGAGPGPIHGIVDALTKDRDVLEIKTRGDFLGDVQVLPRRPPKETMFEPRRQTGAARIKREAKRRSRKRR